MVYLTNGKQMIFITINWSIFIYELFFSWLSLITMV